MGRAGRAYRALLATAVVVTAVALAASPTGASAQQGRQFGAMADRVDRLQRDVEVLQEQVYRGGPPPVSVAQAQGEPGLGISENARYRADLEVRLSQIETRIAALNGRNEELSHALGELRQRLDKLQSDIELRLTALERAAGLSNNAAAAAPGRSPGPAPAPGLAPQGSATPGPPPSGDGGIANPGPGAPPRALGTLPKDEVPAGAPPPQPAPSKTASLPPGSASDQYDYAINLLLKRQDFAGAEVAFKQFLAAHPKDELSGNAQYWLGETYYVRKDYQNAAFAFAEGIEKFPKSPKAPDSLLKLGMSLARLDKTAQACTAFSRLKENFPHASSTVMHRAAAEQQRLKCKS